MSRAARRVPPETACAVDAVIATELWTEARRYRSALLDLHAMLLEAGRPTRRKIRALERIDRALEEE